MQSKLPVVAVNGVIGAQVSPLDRGFMYGDGVFETCNLQNAKIPLWDFHKERLLFSGSQLRIPLAIDVLGSQVKALVSNSGAIDAVVKVTVTRGQGGRGYKMPEPVQPTVVIGIFPNPGYPASYFVEGITARLCKQRLGRNTSLAGLKHLNRLEQILARAEWNEDSIAEGIMFDSDNQLIEGVFSNIFVAKNGVLYTPDLSQAGVSGIMRRLIVEQIAPQAVLPVFVCNLGLAELATADEIFMCNSLYGIWPVRQIIGLDDYQPAEYMLTRKLQTVLSGVLNKLSI